MALQGLTEREAEARRAAGQDNVAPPPTGRTYAQIIRENVFSFLNNTLFLLSLALVLVGRPLDALVSVGVVAANILVAVVQEIRAKRTLDRVALLARPTATVLREGKERTLRPEQLVIGDVVKVGAGDQIVLDGRVDAGRMRVDESLLTGEADLVPKGPCDTVYSGTFCANGSAYYEVEAVGAASLANQITAGARSFRRVLTPLQEEINFVIRIIILIVGYLQLLLIVNALVKAVPFRESVGQATILAGLVPNGLYLAIAVTYALGAVRILRSGALVQQSNAIESLSNVDVLCLDKTGTLTANRLTVTGVFPVGIGEQELKRALGTAVASATARNKTSEAIAAAFPAEPRPLLAEVPFSSALKWSAVAMACPATAQPVDALRGIYALGAPECLRPFLDAASAGDSPTWLAINTQASAWADEGLRVLLIAHHPDPSQLADRGDDSRLPGDMAPLGLVALSDELRPEARETLASFRAAGVAPKIISGDSPETVAALALQAGLGPEMKTISGQELAQLSDAEIALAAEDTTIFGRITPRQKEGLVEALRQRGHYVAMIGDGVNDVLSLKKANVGIAMASGSPATRAVADIVLMNDSFATLAPAVLEGQRIRNGMQDNLKIFLSRISTFALVILSALVVGVFPLELRNTSVITTLTVGIPSFFLALWARPSARSKASLQRELFHFILPPAVFSSLIGLALFYGTIGLRLWSIGLLGASPEAEATQRAIAASVPFAQTALSTFLVFCGLFLLIFVEPPTAWWAGGNRLSGDWKPALLAIALMAAYLLITVVPVLRTLFALSPLEPRYIPPIIGALAVWLVLLRLCWRKWWIERFLGMERAW